jgi:tRNA pseudouridine32 synthase/23S rRNA pseudouridine746 synthase
MAPGGWPLDAQADVGLRLLHADTDCLVVDKPAGLLSVPGRGADKQDCVATRLQAQYPEARVVHRLDMATSGVMLMARGLDAQRALSRAFEQGHASKRYVAVVHGRMTAPQALGPTQTWEGESGWGLIDLPLAADWPRRPLQQVDLARGRPSRSLWRILALEGSCTRVELAPLTGRSHQLRVHLQALGHPIVGDPLYAPAHSADPAGRLLLHAQRLSVPHPTSGSPVGWSSPPPF